ncbi:MAG: DUF4281 domain-containing protein [Oceanicaulis sp.]|uniref:ABA4-like family protein n=1 Tax=Glycocaulis sp. TaxID=1969725 RepID=UPI0025C16397|nr:ABA4-like family protein [Glycocaulis sp.]MCC5982019.1 DUF4281 domain-containing protein [Oceanicaulis sp.]MCH8522858.1 DUF4281 domain-containing protein [Glycocaulis sp.]
MDFELLFSLAGVLAMAGWVALLLSPWMPKWSDGIAGLGVPLLLSIGYTVLLVFVPSQNGGGFGSLAEVSQLFSSSSAMLAGWVHFLAFDLVVGAWICRKARQEGIRFWMVVPCLPVTFLFGPAGFLMFTAVRGLKMRLTAPAR